jgi:hypothetical protein
VKRSVSIDMHVLDEPAALSSMSFCVRTPNVVSRTVEPISIGGASDESRGCLTSIVASSSERNRKRPSSSAIKCSPKSIQAAWL